jgi:hypothetical protein
MSKQKRQGRWLMTWTDETSMYDPKGRWLYGSECAIRDYRAWIPNAIKKNDDDSIQTYLEHHPGAFV